MSTIESRKRKREADPPRVTFSTPSRTFERLLKERSLDALRSAVIKKLGLDARTSLEFCQIRDGKSIDLEDEDDFEAFKAYAASNGVAEVRVNSLHAPAERFNGPITLEASLPAVSIAVGQSSVEASQMLPALGVVSPISQANGLSGSQEAPEIAPDHVSQVKWKRKEKQGHQAETVSSSAPVEVSSAFATDNQEASKSKHVPEVRLEGTSSGKTTPVVSEPDTVSQENIVSILPMEQESPAASKPVKKGKEKNDNGKKSKKKDPQATVPAAELTTSRSSESVSPGVPSVSSIPPSSSSGPVPALPAPAPSCGRNKLKSNKPVAYAPPKPVHGTSPSPERSVEKPTAISSPRGNDRHENRSREAQPENQKSDAASHDKSKKRKRETDSKASSAPSGTSKSKKQKTSDDIVNSSIALPPKPELTTTSDATLVPAQRKATKAKKKSKLTPEEMSQFNADLDSVIANVLAKRVSASSKQNSSTAPITTTASPSVLNKELNKEHTIDVSADNLSISKQKQMKKSKKGKESEVSTTALSASEGDLTGAATVESKVPGQHSSQQKKALQDTSLKSSGLNADGSVPDTEQTAIAKKVPHKDSTYAKELRRVASITATVQSESTTSRTQLAAKASEHRKTTNKDIVASISQNKEQPITSRVPPLAASGRSSISAAQRTGEGSSSDSDSISEFSESDDSDKENVVAASRPQRSQENESSHVIPPNTATFFEPDSSFPTGNLDFNDSLDIDALLHPQSTLSWRDIPLSPDDGNGDEEKLMSDAEQEEEEEEKHKKAPRNSMPFRRGSPSSSVGEDDEDELDCTSDLGEDSKVTTNRAPSCGSTAALRETESGLLTNVKTSCAASEQPSRLISSRTDTPMAGPDKDALHADSPLPSLKDVNARGESVLSEGEADFAVNQAMEADDTLFLTGLDRSSRKEFPMLPPARTKGRAEDEGQAALSDSRGGSVGNVAFITDTSKQSEERNSYPVALTSSLRSEKVPSSIASNAPVVDSPRPLLKKRMPGQDAKATPQEHAGTLGKVRHMKGRRKVELKESASQPSLNPDRAYSPTVTLTATQDFAESTPASDRGLRSSTRHTMSTVSEEPRGPQFGDQATYETAGQGKHARSASPEQPEGTKFAMKQRNECRPEPGVISEPSSQEEGTELLQGTRHESSRPAAVQARAKGDAGSQISIGTVEYLATQERVNSTPPVLQDDPSVDTGRNISNVNSGSTTEVERSVAGDKNDAHDESPFSLSTQLGRKRKNPEERVPSAASSSTGVSQSDDDDKHPLMEQVHRQNPRASLVGLRSLTDIASRRDLFSPASTPRASFPLSPVRSFSSQMPAGNAKGKDGDDHDSSSSSSSSSDSDSENESNIPKERRAGNTVLQSKSYRGLESMTPFF